MEETTVFQKVMPEMGGLEIAVFVVLIVLVLVGERVGAHIRSRRSGDR